MKKFSSFNGMFFNNFSESNQNSQTNNTIDPNIFASNFFSKQPFNNADNVEKDKNATKQTGINQEKSDASDEHISIYDPEYNLTPNQNNIEQNKKQTERKQLSSHAQHLYSCMQNHDKMLNKLKK